jgi:hypothetical protein
MSSQKIVMITLFLLHALPKTCNSNIIPNYMSSQKIVMVRSFPLLVLPKIETVTQFSLQIWHYCKKSYIGLIVA